MQPTILLTSPKKAWLLLAASLAFVILGYCLAFDVITDKAANANFRMIVGIVTMLFFGLGVPVAISRLVKTKEALRIDDKGVHVLTELTGKITSVPWDDITGFSTVRINRQTFIVIDVINARKWIHNENNYIMKVLMKFNTKNYNSPFNLTANYLNISTPELLALLEKYRVTYEPAS